MKQAHGKNLTNFDQYSPGNLKLKNQKIGSFRKKNGEILCWVFQVLLTNYFLQWSVCNYIYTISMLVNRGQKDTTLLHLFAWVIVLLAYPPPLVHELLWRRGNCRKQTTEWTTASWLQSTSRPRRRLRSTISPFQPEIWECTVNGSPILIDIGF